MQITHEEARQLIHFDVDHTLPITKKELLNSHLKDCVECNHYKQEIEVVGDTLQTTMQKHWNGHHRHLDVQPIKAKINPSWQIGNFLTTRSALIGLVVLLFMFVSWQFVTSNNATTMSIVSLSPIPTPSLLFTGTNNSFSSCQKKSTPCKST